MTYDPTHEINTAVHTFKLRTAGFNLTVNQSIWLLSSTMIASLVLCQVGSIEGKKSKHYINSSDFTFTYRTGLGLRIPTIYMDAKLACETRHEQLPI